MNKMRFGYANISVDPLLAVKFGVEAEKSGFDSLWVPDHLVDVNGDKVEPWTTLSAVAVLTKKIRLGSAVTDTQRSHPVRTAHSVTCLDAISRGRAMLGIGAGEAMNIVPFGLLWEDPSTRIARLTEAVQVIRLLWSSSRENTVSFSGRFYRLDNAFLSQEVNQKPHPPIYVGAMASEKALRVVGQFGDGWYSWFTTPEVFRKRWSIIKQAAESSGRSAETIRACTHIMIAFPKTSEEWKAAMLAAKATLYMERTILRSLGQNTSPIAKQYQNLVISKKAVEEVLENANRIPDELVYKTMAIGGKEEVIEKVEELSKAGVDELEVADFLAPHSWKRTFSTFRSIIREYR